MTQIEFADAVNLVCSFENAIASQGTSIGNSGKISWKSDSVQASLTLTLLLYLRLTQGGHWPPGYVSFGSRKRTLRFLGRLSAD